MQTFKANKRVLAAAIAAATCGAVISTIANAQEAEQQPRVEQSSQIEEVIVFGRLKSSAESIVDERFNEPFSADILGSEQMTRIGDSDVAAAVRRTPGVTLVDGKFVYIRGLGERYSSVRLNGAAIPSPELSRNVIPLDLMPTSIVDSIKIQKSFSADLPATFGGGNINIRTKGAPDDRTLNIGIGTGYSSNNDIEGLISYNGHASNTLPSDIHRALNSFQGDIGVAPIGAKLDLDGGQTSQVAQDAARQINQDLILSLDRDVAIGEDYAKADFDAKIAVGDLWDITDSLAFGAIISANHENTERNKNEIVRSVGSPDVSFENVRRTLEEKKQTLSANFAFEYNDNHKLEFNNYEILNSVDDASIALGETNDFNTSNGQGLISYVVGFEERKLNIHQAVGTHELDVDVDWIPFVDTIKGNWFYSDSKAKTIIPNELTSNGTRVVNPATGATLSSQLSPNSVASFGFLELNDDVESEGISIELPMTFGAFEVSALGGYGFDRKVRQYYGYTMNIDATGIPNSSAILTGTPAQVLSDSSIVNNNFQLTADKAFGTESYVAAQKTLSGYGAIDLMWNNAIRFNLGVRWEEFQQGLLPIDLLDFDGLLIQSQIETLETSDQDFATSSDDFYPSAAITYMRPGFMAADDFQLRFSYSATVVRPDLREVAPIQYIDPELNQRVVGNQGLEYTELDHFDLRGEWLFENSDTLTASLFYKDITNPIESVRNPGSDDDILLTFYNGSEGEIYGLELEGLKSLPWNFFLSSNITLSESEVVAPVNELVDLRNSVHPMTGHSEYVANMQLGYDSNNGLHSVSVVYNVFGERLWFSSPSAIGHDDAFEQPFNSVDIIYSFYPTNSMTLKATARNLLDENREFEQTNSAGNTVTIYEQEVGTTLSLDFSYTFF